MLDRFTKKQNKKTTTKNKNKNKTKQKKQIDKKFKFTTKIFFFTFLHSKNLFVSDLKVKQANKI